MKERIAIWLHRWWPTVTILAFFGLLALGLGLSGCRVGLSIG